MRGMGALAEFGIGLSLASGAVPARAAPPDLGACPVAKSNASGEIERKGPLPIPPAYRTVLKSDRTRLAVASLGGETVCVDASWFEQIDRLALSPDQQFLSFHWLGYEAYGHLLVDRRGKGQAVETGVAPVFSPSRHLLAAVDQTESEFGSLSGLAIWRIDPQGITPVAQLTEIQRMQDWRIDGWVGESCINLSAVPLDKLVQSPEELARLPRERFIAHVVKGVWAVSRAGQRGCPPA